MVPRGGWTVTPQGQAQSIPSQVAIKSVLFDNPTGCSGTGLAGPIPIFNDGGTYDYTITGCGSDYPFTNYNDFWFCTAPVPGLNLSVINQQFSSFGLSITAPGVSPQGPFQISCWSWDGSNFGTLSWYAMIEAPVPVITGVQIYDTSGNVLSTFPIGGQAIITLYGSNLGQQFDSYGNTVGSLLLCSAPGVCPGSGLTLQAINSWSDNGQQYGSQINALVSAASSVSGPFYVAVKTSYWTGFALQARAAAVPAAPVPAITVSSGNSLWFFGLDANGAFNVPPATFTQGDIKTTLTAAGGGAGSYTWVITQGSRKVSFASGAALPLISTMVPNVTLYSLSASTNINDVTVTVTWTDGPGQPSARLMLNVDSPETLRLLNVPLNQAVSDCTANHTPGLGGWWVQYQWRQISYFSVVIQGQSINEAFSQTVQYPAPAYPNGDNWGWRANGSAGVAGVSTFVDNYCNAEQDFVPPPTNPQVPQLGNTLVNCAVQTYHSCPRQQII